MLPETINLLLIDNDPAEVALVRGYLIDGLGQPFTITHVYRLSEGLKFLGKQNDIHVILLDLKLPDCSGLDTFRRIFELYSHIPIVILSGAGSEIDALTAVRAGAQDYLLKEKINGELLSQSIQYSIQRVARLSDHEDATTDKSAVLRRYRELVGKLSLREREVLDAIADGNSLHQIAADLGTSYYTVKNQRASIVKKMEAQSDADLVKMVMTLRLGKSAE